MNRLILTPEVQGFIHKNLREDIGKTALSKSPIIGVSAKELAEQIDGKQRAEKKLPTWFKTAFIYYPSKLNLEQCSSETTAIYKSSLVVGETLVDLTGGFGVDAIYFAKRVENVVHCEIDRELSAIAESNAKQFGIENIAFHAENGLEYLKSSELKFDTVYIDPSRRIETRKVFLLKDCEPDIIENLDFILSKTKRLIIKTSPLYDIQSGIGELKNIKEIHVVSVKNDCKELLWILDSGSRTEPNIVVASFLTEEFRDFRFKRSEEKLSEISKYLDPKVYLYEPDTALLKAGCFKLLASKFSIEKLNVNTHLYTSTDLRKNFPGKIFKVIEHSSYKDFSKLNTIKKANIICRNFPYSPEEIKKKYKIADGGDIYLLFAKGPEERLITIKAKRI